MKGKSKKAYQRPTLTVHGDVADITRYGDADNKDTPKGASDTAYPDGSPTC